MKDTLRNYTLVMSKEEMEKWQPTGPEPTNFRSLATIQPAGPWLLPASMNPLRREWIPLKDRMDSWVLVVHGQWDKCLEIPGSGLVGCHFLFALCSSAMCSFPIWCLV